MIQVELASVWTRSIGIRAECGMMRNGRKKVKSEGTNRKGWQGADESKLILIAGNKSFLSSRVMLSFALPAAIISSRPRQKIISDQHADRQALPVVTLPNAGGRYCKSKEHVGGK